MNQINLGNDSVCGMMAVISLNYKYIFRDISIEWPGSVHDTQTKAVQKILYGNKIHVRYHNPSFYNWKFSLLLSFK